MNVISKKVKDIAQSLTLEITAKAKAMQSEGISIVSFGAGEPDFNTPDYIVNGAKEALDKGYTKYTPVAGMVCLKEEICKKFKKDNGLIYTPSQIVVSTGAKSSLFHVISVLVDDGDEVILPSPYWLTYPELVKFAGGKCVFVNTTIENGYKMTAHQFENSITDKTKCLILNTPNNPTGAVYSKDELSAIAKVAEKHGIYVISDEIYEKLVYGNKKHYSIAGLSDYMKEHTIVVNGMSKSFAMTGWRIGYIAAPEFIAKAVTNVQSHTTSNANSIAQYASFVALEGGEEFIKHMVETFEERRDIMFEMLKKIPELKTTDPDGAFYMFVDVSSVYGKKYNGILIKGSMDFAKLALNEGIAVIPGIAFGDDNCIRLSYAISLYDIKVGIERLKNFINKIN